MRKSLIVMICLFTLLPYSKVSAKEGTDHSLSEVINSVINQSLDAKLVLTDKEFPLSAAAYGYQEGFNGLKVINIEIQNLTKRSILLGVEYEANRLVYSYYKEGLSFKLQEDNLKVLKKEYQNIQEKYNEGLASKRDILLAKKGLREEELAMKSAKLKLSETTSQLNQIIGRELNEELKIQSLAEFSLLSPTEYDAEILAEELKGKYPSIVLIQRKLQEYQNILSSIDSLPNFDESEFLKQSNGFEQQIKGLTDKIDDTNLAKLEEEFDGWKTEREKVELAHKKISQEYDKARENGSLSPVEKANYFKKIKGFEQQGLDLSGKIEDRDSEIQGVMEALTMWVDKKKMVEVSRDLLLKEYNKSIVEQRKARIELKEYYTNEIEKTKIERVKEERKITNKVTQLTNQFEILSNQIKLAEEKVEEASYLHDQQKELYDLGEIVFTDVQKSQQLVLANQVELANYQLDYQILKAEFTLFKNGYLM